MKQKKEVEEKIVDLWEELSRAVEAKKAPVFKLLSYSFLNRKEKEGYYRIKIDLRLLLDGQEIEVSKEQVKKKEEEIKVEKHAFNGKLGSFDLIESAFQEAIQKRWPKLSFLKRTESYAVHALSNDSSYQVQVLLGIKNDRGTSRYVVKLIGIDTVATTIEGLTLIYHWLTWRGLRRLRGKERQERRKEEKINKF
jgi:hypothetical protein